MSVDEHSSGERTLSPAPSGDGAPHHEIYKRNKRVIAAELRGRVMWFIRLRWFVPFCIGGLAGATRLMGFGFNLTAVLSIAMLVLVYNLVFYLIGRRTDLDPLHSNKLYTFTYSQVGLDYLALFLLVYFSGGVTSPIIFVFIFHIIFASILLPPRSAFGFAAVAVIGMAAMGFAELTGALAHRPLSFRGDTIILFEKPWYVVTLLVFFSGAIVATAVSVTAVTRMLKKRIIENANFYEQIEHLTEERWRFMRKAAHNLRAPLVAVISMLDMIRNQYLGTVEARQLEYLNRIDRRARHMTKLIDELMAIARSRTKTALPSPHPIAVPTIAGRIGRTFIDEAKQKGLTFYLNVPDTVADIYVDLELVEPILENLVSNAIKYTAKGEVRLSFSSSEPTLLNITIQDTGIGIPKEDQSQLFREFFRAHNARTIEEVGTGLGLALVKETLDKNGGRIEFESRLNEGTTFRVFIPIHQDYQNETQ